MFLVWIMRLIVSKGERPVLRHEPEVITPIEPRKSLAAVLTAEQIDEHGYSEHAGRADGGPWVIVDWRIEVIDNTEGGGFFLGIISVFGKSARKYIDLQAFPSLQLAEIHRALRDVLRHCRLPAALLRAPKIKEISSADLAHFSF